MSIKIKGRLFSRFKSLKIVVFFCFLFLVNPQYLFADSAQYFYDSLGRLERVVNGTSGTVYKYDELGNLISITTATTLNASPVITGISPNVLFVGQKILVSISGQNRKLIQVKF